MSTNAAFTHYRKNFLQVDIFYKELTYEQITQQKAFELLSLFSEIGGLLGLLLGASVLTVCELLDYIVSLITRCVKRRKHVVPEDVYREKCDK